MALIIDPKHTIPCCGQLDPTSSHEDAALRAITMAEEDERFGRGRSRRPAAREELQPPRVPHVLLVVFDIHLLD
uniref:Uncharacterized protein n=1 Tax=Arundo donax TaxID=35708 RepID=A0A0A9ACT5_ARUDO